MIREGWASGNVKASPLARDDEFMRRAYLDVLGRTPNIAEAKAFLTAKDAGKRAKLVEYLLAHPDYEKNFATIWKVILIGRTNQGQNIDEKSLRDWLRRKFADNRPWNEIAYELITAGGNNKTNGAANFVMSHLEMGAVPLTSVTTRVFLGQQIQCTQCHDHPSNDWKQADFWGINAFLKGIKTEQVRVENAEWSERGRPRRGDRRAARPEPGVRQLRAPRRADGDRLPDVPRRPQDPAGRRRESPPGASELHHRAGQRRLREGVRQPDVGTLPRPGVRASRRRLRRT